MEFNSKIDEQIKQYEEFMDMGKRNNPCDNCPNNPKNNPYSSGVCHCILPTLYNPIY